jgi:hypothetical protein
MSSVTFTKVKDYNPEDVCGICLQPLGTDCVAHDGGKNNTKIHPCDVNCLKTWLLAHPDDPTCPICRAKVNTQSLFSWKEKLVAESKKESFSGEIFAAIFAGCLLLLFGLEVYIHPKNTGESPFPFLARHP